MHTLRMVTLALLCSATRAQVDFPPSVVAFPGPAALTDIALADVDGDGDPDLLASEEAFGSVELYLNDGAGHFGPASLVAQLVGPTRLATGDLDGDGATDLAVLQPSNQRVLTYRGDGAGGFALQQVLGIPGQLLYVLLADLDGDGLDDLCVSEALAPAVWIAMATGAGAVAPSAGRQTTKLPSSALSTWSPAML